MPDEIRHAGVIARNGGKIPLCRGHAETGARPHIACVLLAPQLAPAGVDNHGVARLQSQFCFLSAPSKSSTVIS